MYRNTSPTKTHKQWTRVIMALTMNRTPPIPLEMARRLAVEHGFIPADAMRLPLGTFERLAKDLGYRVSAPASNAPALTLEARRLVDRDGVFYLDNHAYLTSASLRGREVHAYRLAADPHCLLVVDPQTNTPHIATPMTVQAMLTRPPRQPQTNDRLRCFLDEVQTQASQESPTEPTHYATLAEALQDFQAQLTRPDLLLNDPPFYAKAVVRIVADGLSRRAVRALAERINALTQDH